MILVAVYAAFMLFVAYFCVVADPEKSALGRFLSEELPQRVWAFLARILGKKSLQVLEWIVDRALILVYITVVFGSWSVIFAYVYPWIASQSYVSQYHRGVGVLVFGICVTTWRYASTTSPGVITQGNLHLFNHFPYDGYMYEAGSLCRTRKISRLARSKFDRFRYGENVARFDHFCGWLYNTIGECNYRWFLLFLLVHVGMCVYGTFVLTHLFLGEVYEKELHTAVFFNRSTGEENQGSWSIIAQYLFARHLVEAAVLMLVSVMGIALGMFLGYHVWLTSRGLTTNESFKWGEVQKWYKTEVRRYEDAVKNGQVVTDGDPNKPVVSDGDVTCVGGGAKASDPKKAVIPIIRHPGPKPVNVYNRGVLKNWEEVLFPIPLRKSKKIAAERKKLAAERKQV
jgi:palmitoyltransferase